LKTQFECGTAHNKHHGFKDTDGVSHPRHSVGRGHPQLWYHFFQGSASPEKKADEVSGQLEYFDDFDKRR